MLRSKCLLALAVVAGMAVPRISMGQAASPATPAVAVPRAAEGDAQNASASQTPTLAPLMMPELTTEGAKPADLKMAKPEPQMQAVLDALASLHGKPIETLSAAEARRQPGPADAVKKILVDKNKRTQEPVEKVEDKTITTATGDLKTRVYTPKGSGPFPVLVYFHGGGWVIADIDTYDASCRAIANLAQCVVVSVDYRKAPENIFPAAADDAFAATQWVMQHATDLNGNPAKVAVGGESVGGNLAAVVCLMCRDRKAPAPVHQLLVYPVVDNDMNRTSYIENAEARPLNRAMMPWFVKQYLPNDADMNNPYAFPLKAQSLSGLPSATIIAAEIDPLRSEGLAYADKLKAAGVAVKYELYKGATHEFFGMGAVFDRARDAEEAAATELKAAFR